MVDGETTWFDADKVGALLFIAVFFLVAVWETFRPARVTTATLSLRWLGNVVLFLLAWAIAAFLPFLTVDSAAVIAREQGWGLLNVFSLHGAVGIALSFIALDFIGYWEHRLYHAVPTLWRLHALHHSDTDLDVTTTIRHHPFEVLTQLPLNMAAAILFGFPPAAIVLYGTVVIIAQLFQHGNVELPTGLRWISTLVVTPALHRVHHSVAYNENNSNFSNFLTIWDRMFGTLSPEAPATLRVGLTEFASDRFQRLDRMLVLPWLVRPVRP
jgi:sterol desaturase/sphingolipid hydroxylase (fatty acid hydroxylase superfamily)